MLFSRPMISIEIARCAYFRFYSQWNVALIFISWFLWNGNQIDRHCGRTQKHMIWCTQKCRRKKKVDFFFIKNHLYTVNENKKVWLYCMRFQSNSFPNHDILWHRLDIENRFCSHFMCHIIKAKVHPTMNTRLSSTRYCNSNVWCMCVSFLSRNSY